MKTKAKAKAWLGIVAAMVANLVASAQQAALFLTDEVRCALLAIWDAGEQQFAPEAMEAAIAQVIEHAGKASWSGKLQSQARRVAAAVQSGKLKDGKPLTRDALANLGWNELCESCETRTNRGAKSGAKASKAAEKKREKDGIVLNRAAILAYMKSRPTLECVTLLAGLAQEIVNRKDAPKELKAELVKPIETLRKIA